MAHAFGDAVTYVKDGKDLNGIVLKSAVDSTRELLTILYVDPERGPAQVMQGNLKNIAQIAIGTSPLVQGAKFGWTDAPVRPKDPSSVASVQEAKAASIVSEQKSSTKAESLFK